MTLEDIIRKTRRILTEEFEIEEALIIPDASLKLTLGIDSLDYVDIVVFIEKDFGIRLTINDFKNIITFGQFCDMLHKKLEETDGEKQ